MVRQEFEDRREDSEAEAARIREVVRLLELALAECREYLADIEVGRSLWNYDDR